jgi:chromate transporter
VSGPLGALLALYAQLSLLAVGGVNSVLPEMQRQVVEVHGWLGARDFAALFALAQAAPGPNMMISTVVGWHVAGWAGALVATGGMIGPSSLLTWATASAWHRFREAPWRRAIQAGLRPVTAGLVIASAWLLVSSTTTGWVTGGITLCGVAVLLATRLHPLAVLAAGAAIGALWG